MDDQLLKHLSLFRNQRILVVGDIMLDRYIHGTVGRVAPEAPVPVVHVRSESLLPGGAANVANNVVSLNGMVSIVALAGNDALRWKLFTELEQRNIPTSSIVVDASRPTTQKTKLVSRNQQLLRLDHEQAHEAAHDVEQKLIDKFREAAQQCDVVVISDYRKGVLTQSFARAIIEHCKSNNIMVVADAKPESVRWYTGATVVTLNTAEAQRVSGLAVENDEDIAAVGKALAHDLSAAIVLTAGSKGMHVFENAAHKHIAPEKIDLADPSGAGDTVTAALALGLATGASLFDAAKISNYAGSITASKPGTTNPTLTEVQNVLKTEINEHLKENIKVKQTVINNHVHEIEQITNMIIGAYENNKKVLLFGNGGSAADAMHWAAELVGRFKMERRGLPAINLTADSSIMTAVGNDYGFDQVFSRQVEALAHKDDVLIGISTSGNSPNVIKAMELGRKMGTQTICMLGKDGGKLKDLCDVSIIVPSNNTPRIQETHITVVHIICELLEKRLFS